MASGNIAVGSGELFLGEVMAKAGKTIARDGSRVTHLVMRQRDGSEWRAGWLRCLRSEWPAGVFSFDGKRFYKSLAMDLARDELIGIARDRFRSRSITKRIFSRLFTRSNKAYHVYLTDKKHRKRSHIKNTDFHRLLNRLLQDRSGLSSYGLIKIMGTVFTVKVSDITMDDSEETVVVGDRHVEEISLSHTIGYVKEPVRGKRYSFKIAFAPLD